MYTRKDCVQVYPFTRQVEGEQVVIGQVEAGTFLAIPLEAVEVLDDLAAGKSVGEVQDLYYQRYGEIPELEEFLGLLESKGFVWPGGSATGSGNAANPLNGRRVRYHFSGFPETLARKLFGKSALLILATVTAIACGVAIFEPALIPGPSSLYFPEHRAISIIILMMISYASLFIHEMGHLVAARAVGVNSRLGISHRLWYLVGETDLTGLWALPKRQRYLPLLAGMLVDIACSDLLVLLLALNHAQLVILPVFIVRLIRAILFSFFVRLLWQFFLFLRTDMYYVIASLFNCKNLLRDTEDFIRNKLFAIGFFSSAVDQSGIPVLEMRVVRGYSVVWILGRIAAFSFLLLISVPLAVRYVSSVSAVLRAGFAVDPYGFVDSLALAAYSLIPLTLGFALWMRSLLQRKRSWR
jgi:putative peptide zinc metalloprotease protein